MKKIIIGLASVLLLILTSKISFAVPTLLHNDHRNSALENLHLDGVIPHNEFEEELERGSIEREITFEINELTNTEEHILEQTIKTPNHVGADSNSRTNFFSNDDHDDPAYQNNIFSNSDDFFYWHQLPPSINPDVTSGPAFFNDYNFTHSLIEFEFEFEGWTTVDPSNTQFEVFIISEEIFDSNAVLTSWKDVGKLGDISFGSASHHGRYEFDFDFEQYGQFDGVSTFISPEIYTAIGDGLLGIHIERSWSDGTGPANLFLEESELELEQPAPVPEPSTFILMGSGIAILLILCKKVQRKSV